MCIMNLLAAFPHINPQDLFDIALYYNSPTDVECLINKCHVVPHVSTCIKELQRHGRTEMFSTIFKHIEKTPLALTELANAAIVYNSRVAMTLLLPYVTNLSKVLQFLIISGAGKLSQMKELPFTPQVMHDLGDECIETAYLCRNRETLEFLLSHASIRNPFLIQRIREDSWYAGSLYTCG